MGAGTGVMHVSWLAHLVTCCDRQLLRIGVQGMVDDLQALRHRESVVITGIEK